MDVGHRCSPERRISFEHILLMSLGWFHAYLVDLFLWESHYVRGKIEKNIFPILDDV